MAVAGIRISADFPELNGVRDSIRNLGDKKFTAAALKDALEKAIFPAYMRLREITPIGPTGNLKAAASYLVKAYPKDGTAVGLIGYKRSGQASSRSAQGGSARAGSDRAYHQWWLEYGTKQRVIAKKSVQPYGRRGHTRRIPGKPAVEVRPHVVKAGQNQYVASSFNKLGPFQMVRRDDGRIATDPAYPRAFFKASKNPIAIPPTPAGGVRGIPPVRSAFEESQGKVAFILTQELKITLQRAIDTLTIQDTGTLSGV